jgi:predicted SAM-dependent methyltransferase
MSSPARVPASAADFDPATAPRRLNLGCGWDHREGYVNVDFHAHHAPDLSADVRKLGFLPASHYEEIVAQDVLEHLPRRQTLPVLRHWNRLLAMGGTLVIRVPNVLALADLLRLPEYQDPEKQKEVIHFLFGTQAYDGDYHLTTFTDVLLRHYLEEAGFKTRKIEPWSYWTYDVTATKARHVEGPEVFDFDELSGIEDDTEFVHACYRTVLGREPDPAGLAYYVGELRAGKKRNSVLGTFLASDEHRSRKPYE